MSLLLESLEPSNPQSSLGDPKTWITDPLNDDDLSGLRLYFVQICKQSKLTMHTSYFSFNKNLGTKNVLTL